MSGRPGLATSRRGAIAGGCGAVVAQLLAAAAVHAAPRDLRFEILMGGRKIGEHGLRFAATAQGHRVASEIDIAVKIAFVTAYRYVQTGEDVWQDAMLATTRITTADNGERTRVTAEMQGERLVVTGPAGVYALPPGAMTDLAFWSEAITRQPRLIDSQNGELVTVAVTADGTERVQISGTEVQARRFALAGSRNRSGLVWYDDGGRLVRAEVRTRGRTLDYRLAA